MDLTWLLRATSNQKGHAKWRKVATPTVIATSSENRHHQSLGAALVSFPAQTIPMVRLQYPHGDWSGRLAGGHVELRHAMNVIIIVI